MNRKVIVSGLLIVTVILLVGAVVGAPTAQGAAHDLTTLSADDISAYRWNAMAKFYSEHRGRDLTTLSAGDISAYRWNAMAKFYSKP